VAQTLLSVPFASSEDAESRPGELSSPNLGDQRGCNGDGAAERGVRDRIVATYVAEWSVVANWTPEKRYQLIGQSTPQEAADMVRCVKKLLDTI